MGKKTLFYFTPPQGYNIIENGSLGLGVSVGWSMQWSTLEPRSTLFSHFFKIFENPPEKNEKFAKRRFAAQNSD